MTGSGQECGGGGGKSINNTVGALSSNRIKQQTKIEVRQKILWSPEATNHLLGTTQLGNYTHQQVKHLQLGPVLCKEPGTRRGRSTTCVCERTSAFRRGHPAIKLTSFGTTL